MRECLSLSQRGFDVSLAACGDLTAVNSTNVTAISIPSVTGRFKRLLTASWRAVRSLRKFDHDILHLHDPELIPAGLWWRFRGRHVVYDAHEDLPRQILDKAYLPRWSRTLISIVVDSGLRLAFPRLSGLVTATEPIAERVKNKRVQIVCNFPDTATDLAGVSSNGIGTVYIGGLADARGLFDMLGAAQIIMERSGTKIDLLGGFDGEATKREAQGHNGWPAIVAHGHVGREEVVTALNRCNIGLLPLKPTPAYVDALPVKLFEYMAAGLAVIAAEGHEWSRIIEEHRCGVFYPSGDAEALANAILNLQENPEETRAMGNRGRAAIDAHFNWQKEADGLADFYRSIL